MAHSKFLIKYGTLRASPCNLYLPRLVRYGEILFDNFAILVGVIRRQVFGLPIGEHPPKQTFAFPPKADPPKRCGGHPLSSQRFSAKADNKAQTIIEFTLLVVIVIMALIGMQPLLKRAMAGNLRASSDSLGDQFSPRWTKINKVSFLQASINENTTFGNTTKTTQSTRFLDEDIEVADIGQESAELKNYLSTY